MTPILRKSKEAGKTKTRTHRDSSRDVRPIGNNTTRFLRIRGGRGGRRLFLTSRSRLASLARNNMLNDARGSSRDHHHRYSNWFGRGDSPYSK